MQFMLRNMASKYSQIGTITKAGQIMTEPLEAINLPNTAQEAALKMADKNISLLVVIDDNGKAAGVVRQHKAVVIIRVANKATSIN